MKIKRISCTQFAGMRDKSVELTGGVNVIYGKNESGKSTLVNLLARTLFQNAKLDGRSDRGFRELYFPAGRGDGAASADFVDGTVTIEGADGTYTLSKAWGAGAGCTLSAPDGAVRDQKKINEILRGVLLYGEGVYHDILLTARREQGRTLETLLDAARKTEAKREIAGAAARAFVESGGISIEAVGAAIAAKRKELEGAHWDAERGGPERRASGRWSKELGEVLKAWYALEDAQETLARVERLEDAADRAAAEYADADAAAAEAERELRAFGEYAGRLEARSERKQRLVRMEAELEKLRGVLDEWAELAEQRDAAGALKAAAEEARRCAERLDALPNPAARELRDAAEADREIQRLENRLFGMNLAAQIRMLDGRSYELRSLRTGETLHPEGEQTFKITEAVRLTVPGVMELTLSPADVDAAAVGRRLEAERSRLGEIYARYSVASIVELQALADARRAAENELSAAEKRRTLALSAAQYAALRGEIETLRASVENFEDMPPEYLALADPKGHLASLRERLAAAQRNRDAALAKKSAVAAQLETCREALDGEPQEAAARAEERLREQRELLAHWKHIEEVYFRRKSEFNNAPMQDIAECFAHYLGLISRGRDAAEFPEADQPEPQLYSGGRLLDYAKLSEGTKDTVALAYRLAVLDHLFPEGGGVVVFDDPFTDMDAERTEQACALLREFAARHQVIFLTCREEYLPALGGNVIRMDA